MSDLIPLGSLLDRPSPQTVVGRVALIALGCAKNLVDAEQMLGLLTAEGYEVVTDAAAAEVVIVNTCSFLEAAREEAIREIRAASRFKTKGRCEVLVVSGCLAQLRPELVREKCPQVDLVVGVSEFPQLAELLAGLRGRPGERPVAVSLPNLPYQEYLPRRLATPPWTAYQKIAEGCNCNCSFCIIPTIRGSFRSRPLEALVAEATRLAAGGVRELVLIAEDLTHWGRDQSDGRRLADLVRALGAVPGLDWVRLLYCYPTKVDDALLEAMATTPQVVRYLDMPLQHAADPVLRAMNRGGRRASYLKLIERLRAALPDICLRSTFIVGFPGERRQEYQALESFLTEARLDRVGFFAYSPEPGTPAAELPGQVPRGVAEARIAQLAALQEGISRERNEAQIGRHLAVLVEAAGDGRARGRSYRDAPEIDGVVHLTGAAQPGELVTAEITAAGVHDLHGRVVG
ncbi:MAG: 30S ribosomal protein S12 methylthiotransferase RimO [Fimbriimonadaceae bacterium]|nr:30S ribosomal protein S12 methylthiotransferase RimO [Fimbriimonadaceae bacterium]